MDTFPRTSDVTARPPARSSGAGPSRPGPSRPGPARAVPSGRRRLGRVLAALAVALALVAPAPVAQAEDELITPFSSSQCDIGNFCVWSGSAYSGSFWQTASLGLQNTGIAVARSVWNRMSVDVRMYTGTNGSGTIRCWQNGQQNGAVTVGSASIRTMTATTC